MTDWLHARPEALRGKKVHRLGLAASFGIDEDGVRAGMDRGVNLFFWTMRGKGLRSPLKAALAGKREDVAVVGITTIGYFGWNVRRSAESLLRELGVEYLDVFLLGWVGVAGALSESTQEELLKLRESGKVKAIGVSIHDRPRAGRLAAESPLDLLMIRYNAAHPGAERDIFPHKRARAPSLLAYTATSWRKLLKKPKGWDGPVMSAGDCYRFQLSHPAIDMALTGPATRAELEANLDEVEKGPLAEDELAWMRDFGKAVHG